MLILLPPSEGKAPSGTGPAVDPESLVLPALAPARREVLAALEELCSGPEDTALEVLGLTPGQADAVKRDLDAATAPTLRAADLYTGVLYDRLGLPELLREHPGRVRERVLVFSGLWGVVGPDDALPPYRLSMGVKLPPLGGLGAYWRRAMAGPLGELAGDRLLVDCRSATYTAAFKPRGAAAERLVSVRVLRERVVGSEVRRSVVSHMAKATRGDIARSLLAEGVEAAGVAELAAALRDLGHTVETPEAKAGAPRVLDVVVRD
ncbi:peroxide stress protein YaaA [Nocardiopsis changdeensis]|uniref:Peroxide stress protein YaaA n=1 Tax=Nocardiopsis changdeensis TaxID=2831969 RepID=A0ABX8BPY5_9ACTN|nr:MULTISPECIES: peroxide stress protein YaaA [Nocardiopsis]QUX24302.1 peroxide stress protein YaaA [Nocardiopsis changdeensis]QYX34694.1 peroxide stress protein YaaA [Nocardiopsis sp. MT53]